MDIVEEVKETLENKVLKFFKKNDCRYYIDIHPKDIVESAGIMFHDLQCRFAIATGIDTPQGFEILYHFSHDKTGKMFTLRVLIQGKSYPEIDSITPVIRGAEWIEREIYEMLGIKFRNHPNLKRLLLADDWPEGIYPLRQKSSL
jgi:NADH:ubiquinone oxidoreductase subunit C